MKSLKLKTIYLLLLAIAATMPVSAGVFIGKENISLNRDGVCYYVTIPREAMESKKYSAMVTGDPAWTSFTIAGKPGNAEVYFGDVSHNRNVVMQIDSAGTAITRSVLFTCLPIIHLHIPAKVRTYYEDGCISVTMPDGSVVQSATRSKRRGGSTNTSSRHKFSYHIKFVDDEGEKVDHKFFDLRNDNSWLLEAMQADLGRCRNRVLTGLWADFATQPYYRNQEPKALNYSRGDFVEVLKNGQYIGIYGMHENLDRKQMKLRKFDPETFDIYGQMWKYKFDSSVLYWKTPDAAPVDTSEWWGGIELKYPQIDEVCPTDYGTLSAAVDFVVHSSDDDFKAHVAEYFDIPVLVDHFVMLDVMNGVDNVSKNYYMACYDQTVDKKLTLAIWDMDATMGQGWNNTDAHYRTPDLKPELTIRNSSFYRGNNLYTRLMTLNAEGFADRVAQRYLELRRSGLFSADSLKARFGKVYDLYDLSGAGKREMKKWSKDSDINGRELNFDTERAYIYDWIERHIAYLDQFYGYTEAIAGDINSDGKVDVKDLNILINIVLGQDSASNYKGNGDLGGDGKIDVKDINDVINIILG